MQHLDDPALWLAVSLALAFFVGAGIVHVMLEDRR
jgi:hypothetical protein